MRQWPDHREPLCRRGGSELMVYNMASKLTPKSSALMSHASKPSANPHPGRFRPAGERQRPSQVPVMDAITRLTGFASAAEGQPQHERQRLRPSAASTDSALRITDPAEQHARSLPAHRMSHVAADGVLQRCGGVRCPPGTCSHEDDNKLMRKGRTADSDAVDASVHDIVASPGQSLDPGARTYFEQRFGHDFGQVRVHTDARAAASARAMNAIAYALGRDVVFDTGYYAPETQRGRKLLAHELTHTLQQRTVRRSATEGLRISHGTDAAEREADDAAAAEMQTPPPSGALSGRLPEGHMRVLQRAEALTIHRLEACGAADDCPSREPGEAARSATAQLQMGALEDTDFIVFGFPVGSPDVSTLAANPAWAPWCGSLASGSNHFEILGFSDCEGGTELNTALRTMRAMNVKNSLPAAAGANIDRFRGAALSDCVAANDTAANRSLNRSVVFHQTVTSLAFPPETITRHPCPPSTQTPAANLDEYLSLVLCAETHTGLGPREMLALLRQLYYGKPWSRVSTTNQWDNVIPCSPNIGNPEGRLGANLFHALRDADEIEGVDVGHIWTGLESMTCPSASVSLFGGLASVMMSNEDFATWGGDLGAAVAAFVACPQIGADAAQSDDCGNAVGSRPLSFYLDISAPSQDLEGDIDAFVIRAASLGIPCRGSAGQTFSPTRPMSEIFLDHVGPPGTTSGIPSPNRYQCFVEAIGGGVSGHRITNGGFQGPIAIRVASFADVFYTKIRGLPHTPDIGEHLVMRAQSELAVDWFLNWLEQRL